MDFVKAAQREIESGPRKGEIELFPDFRVGRSKDLMVRGRSFYAIWDEEAGLWSTDEYDVQRLVDDILYKEADRLESVGMARPKIKTMVSNSTGSWRSFKQYVQNISDNSKPLDENLTFLDTQTKKTDHASKRLPYALQPGDHSAWDELIGTLYDPKEKEKLEWAIGAIVSGDSKSIQKFIVLYGDPGTGKSTYMDIVAKMFEPYVVFFDAKALGSTNGAFSTAVFKDNPLVAIQQDGDLSRIEDNTRLNSIIAHDDIEINEKFKPGYQSRVNAFLFMGTNSPVKISDAKSGLIRRLIDVHPTGKTLPAEKYFALKSRIDFELGAIAHHCLERYRDMGKTYFSAYRPIEMMFQTDPFFNFVESVYDVFKAQDAVTIRQAYSLYKEYCANTGIDKPMRAFEVRSQLRNYFDTYSEHGELDGMPVRSLYRGFKTDKFQMPVTAEKESTPTLLFDQTESIFDELYFDMPAQYANEAGAPRMPWAAVTTTLSDLDTTKLHYVKVPENHIVIDFDLKDEHGGKSSERNLAEAARWPATYGELSQSGGGVHLHYDFTGTLPDGTELDSVFSDGIEVKRYRGGSALRRRLSACNALNVAEINSGLPVKEKKVLTERTVRSEKQLRDMVVGNLQKKYHSGTKPSVDFIVHILDEAYASGTQYDLSDMRSAVLTFAAMSTNQSANAVRAAQRIKWKSADMPENKAEGPEDYQPDREVLPKGYGDDPVFPEPDEEPIVFYDVEVYPNLFVVCWMFDKDDATVIKMINPKAHELEPLLKRKLVGFYNRNYDNHILYAAYMGYSVEALYNLSQELING